MKLKAGLTLKKLKFITTAICLLAIAQSQNARATLINFDVGADGTTAVASGTNISTLYSSLGVTFGCFNGLAGFNLCNAGNAFAISSFDPESAPNVIGFGASSSFFDERNGFLSASFSSLQNTVSIDAKTLSPSDFFAPDANRPFLQAFDSNGNLLATATYVSATCNPSTSNGCPYETLSIVRPTNDIKFVALSSFNNPTGSISVFGEFDNLNFAGGTPVPEPGTLSLLLAAGLAGGGVARTRSRPTA